MTINSSELREIYCIENNNHKATIGFYARWRWLGMLRREFFSLASAAVVPARLVQDTGEPGVSEMLDRLCLAIKSEIAGVTKVEITYDPEDQKVPVMVLAFRT